MKPSQKHLFHPISVGRMRYGRSGCSFLRWLRVSARIDHAISADYPPSPREREWHTLVVYSQDWFTQSGQSCSVLSPGPWQYAVMTPIS